MVVTFTQTTSQATQPLVLEHSPGGRCGFKNKTVVQMPTEHSVCVTKQFGYSAVREILGGNGLGVLQYISFLQTWRQLLLRFQYVSSWPCRRGAWQIWPSFSSSPGLVTGGRALPMWTACFVVHTGPCHSMVRSSFQAGGVTSHPTNQSTTSTFDRPPKSIQ